MDIEALTNIKNNKTLIMKKNNANGMFFEIKIVLSQRIL
jgi:hypothetical protein